MSEQQAQYRINDSDTGRRLMDYASRAHCDAWLSTHPEYRMYSQHTDSAEMNLYAVYVEKQSRHFQSVEGGAS
jgi:hypothetical protein